ncbi:MAG: hypothetical protein O2860_05585 [Chloroflexi bacterium]|nr:hypothetical protein [Chloroflexota bacterium]
MRTARPHSLQRMPTGACTMQLVHTHLRHWLQESPVSVSGCQ